MTTVSQPTGSGFYITGGTVPRDAACYVPRKADTDLLAGLRNGQFCYILTSRQMGKSSLMVRTVLRLREENVICVVLDLAAIGQNLDAERWYGGLLNQLGQQIGLDDELDDFWLAPSSLGPMLRWMQALQQVVLPSRSGNLVIFVDEIDAVRSLPFSADEFFAGIRECYNRRSENPEFVRLTFCLLGVATPSDLIRDTRTTPFNIGRRIELTDFTAEEAAPLAEGLDVGKGHLRAEALLSRVLYWTGGHPYLTQRLCQAISEYSLTRDPQLATGNQQPTVLVDCLCEELFLSSGARERDDNLIFVRERLLRSEVDLTTLLDMYGRVRQGKRVVSETGSPLVSLLLLSGILKVTGPFLASRNRIYAHVFDHNWVRNNMPYAELWRQQQAYRRGVLRTAAVSGIVVLALAALSTYALYQKMAADTKTHEAQRLAHERTIALNQARASAIAQKQAADRANRYASQRDSALRDAQAKGKLAIASAHSQSIAAKAARKAEFRALREANHAQTAELAARKQAATANHLLYIANMNLIQQAWGNSDVRRARELLIETRGYLDRGFEWYYWQRMCHLNLITLISNGTPYNIFSVSFSPDGRRIVTSSWNNIAKVWDASSGRELFTLKGHTGCVSSVAFSADGKRIVTGSYDHTAKVWNAVSGRELLTLKGHKGNVYSISFSPNGRRIVTGSLDRTAKIWNAVSGRELLTLKGHFGSVSSAVFSPDGRRIVTGSADNTAKLWDTASGRELLTLNGHAGEISSVAFSSDGRQVMTGSDDGTAQVWEAARPGQVTAWDTAEARMLRPTIQYRRE